MGATSWNELSDDLDLNGYNVVSANGGSLSARTEPRVGYVATGGTPAIDTDLYDQFCMTAMGEQVTSMSTNLTGTPTDGQRLTVRFKGTNTRAIAWGASFAGNLITATSGTNTHIQELVYDATAEVWVGTYHDATGY